MSELLVDKINKISERKKDHIDISLNSDVKYKKSNEFEKYEFIHDSLTEVNIDEINSFKIVKRNAPKIPKLSNIGAAQLLKLSNLSIFQSIINPIETDGLIIHLNPLWLLQLV